MASTPWLDKANRVGWTSSPFISSAQWELHAPSTNGFFSNFRQFPWISPPDGRRLHLTSADLSLLRAHSVITNTSQRHIEAAQWDPENRNLKKKPTLARLFWDITKINAAIQVPLQPNCLLSHVMSCHVHAADTIWLWSHNYTFIAASNDTCLLVLSEIIMCWLLCGCGLNNYLSWGLPFCQSPWLNPVLAVWQHAAYELYCWLSQGVTLLSP